MLVGIDLFVCRCIEGVQLTRAEVPVTYPPQLTWRQPPKRLGVGACSGFGCLRSERVFRNEFPYLGRASAAAWANCRPVGGNGIVRRGLGGWCTGPAARGARACARRTEGQGSAKGGAQGRSGSRTHRPAG